MADIAMLGIGIDGRQAQQGGAQAADAFNKVDSAVRKTTGGVENFDKHLEKIKNSNQKVAREMGNLDRSVESLGIGINATTFLLAAAGGTFALLIKGVKDTIQEFDNLDESAKRMGMSVSIFRTFKEATKMAGLENSISMIGQLQKNISEAGSDSIEAQKAFYDLKLSFQELEKLSPEEQFFKVLDSLQGIKSQSKKVELAMKVLGREGADSLKLLDNGSIGLRNSMLEIEGIMGKMSDQQIKGIAQMSDEVMKLTLAWKGFIQMITSVVGPALTEMLDLMTKLSVFTRNWLTGDNVQPVQRLSEIEEQLKKDFEKTASEALGKTEILGVKGNDPIWGKIAGTKAFKDWNEETYGKKPLIDPEKQKAFLNTATKFAEKYKDTWEEALKDQDKVWELFNQGIIEIDQVEKYLNKIQENMPEWKSTTKMGENPFIDPKWEEEIKNATEQLAEMSNNLENEYRWLGLTNDEREKEIGLLKSGELLKTKHGGTGGGYDDELRKFAQQYDDLIKYRKAMDDATKAMAVQDEQIRRETELRMAGTGAIRDMWQELDQEKAMLGKTNDEREVYVRTLEFAAAAAEAFGEDVGRAAEEVDRFEAAFRDFAEQRKIMEMWQNLADGMGSAFGSAFEKMITGAGTAKETIAALGKEISTLFLRQMFIQPFSQMISQGFMGGMQGLGIPGLGGGGGGLFGIGGGGGGEFPAPLLNVGGFGYGRQGAPRAAGLGGSGGGDGSPRIMNIRQEIRIMTPNAESFRRSKLQIARDMAALGKSGLRGLRG